MNQELPLHELTPTKRYYDNTILASYKRCPREYFLRHFKGWRKQGLGAALAFGLAWHAAQDVLWRGYGQMPDEDLLNLAASEFDRIWEEQGFPVNMELDQLERLSPRTPMVAREMLAGYLTSRRHILDKMELVACEQPFAVPLPMDSNKPGSTWYCGRLDKVFRFNSQLLVGEHKTTTEYKIDGGFRDNYVQGWYLDSQIMGYLYGGGLFFEHLDQVWVDAALVHKKVHDKFKFIPIAHQWGMLNSWIQDTVEFVSRIEADEAKFIKIGKLESGVFPKNTESCMGKFGPCQFLDICRTQPDPSQLTEPPAGYVVEKWVPFDILKLDKLLQGEAGA